MHKKVFLAYAFMNNHLWGKDVSQKLLRAYKYTCKRSDHLKLDLRSQKSLQILNMDVVVQHMQKRPIWWTRISLWPTFPQQPMSNCYNGYMVNNNNKGSPGASTRSGHSSSLSLILTLKYNQDWVYVCTVYTLCSTSQRPTQVAM